jgi:2,4-dienoyl-CoA reductase-like NADH-dependent reductase (Old Yellow Enzyme family)
MVKVFFPAESQMALHVAETPRPLDLPIDLLDVIVHLRRQHATTFGTPGLKHPTAIPGVHTVAKTVHANTATSLGLVCALWHTETSFKKRAQGALSSSYITSPQACGTPAALGSPGTASCRTASIAHGWQWVKRHLTATYLSIEGGHHALNRSK